MCIWIVFWCILNEMRIFRYHCSHLIIIFMYSKVNKLILHMKFEDCSYILSFFFHNLFFPIYLPSSVQSPSKHINIDVGWNLSGVTITVFTWVLQCLVILTTFQLCHISNFLSSFVLFHILLLGLVVLRNSSSISVFSFCNLFFLPLLCHFPFLISSSSSKLTNHDRGINVSKITHRFHRHF